MARGKNEVVLEFVGKTGNLERALGRVDSRSQGFGSNLAKWGKIAALGVGTVGVAAVGMGIKFAQAADESRANARQTEAVIKSMGAESWLTTDAVGALADELSRKSGIDDDIIRSGQNVLLTFGQVRNEVGKGNDVFDRATTVALDMSVALGQDMQSSVTQLGKALNDPIAGISALSRVGVQFTEDQKAQIETLVEQNDVLGAQKVILDEVERQFTGSAEAQATASGKLQVAWENLQEHLGAYLLPTFEAVSDWILDTGIPALEDLADWVDAKVVPALQDFAAWFQERVMPAVEEFVAFAEERLLPIYEDIWTDIQEDLVPALGDLVGSVNDLTEVFSDNRGKAEGLGGTMGLLKLTFEAQARATGLLVGILSTLARVQGWVLRGWSRLIGVMVDLHKRVYGGWLTGLGAIGDVLSAIARAGERAANAVQRLIERFANLKIPKPGGFNLFSGGLTGFLGAVGFDEGGVIPGPVGAPRLVVAHGGEEVIPRHNVAAMRRYDNDRGGGGGSSVVNVTLYVQGSIRSDRDLVGMVRDELRSGGLQGVAP